MIDTDGMILEFVKHNYITTGLFFFFMKNWAVAHKGVENNSIFTLIAVTLSQVWDSVQNLRSGKLPECVNK
jgi:hypothetical protein